MEEENNYVKESLEAGIDYYFKLVKEQSDLNSIASAEKVVENLKEDYYKEQRKRAIKEGFVCGSCDYLTYYCRCKK